MSLLPNSGPSSEELLLKSLETERSRRLTEDRLRYHTTVSEAGRVSFSGRHASRAPADGGKPSWQNLCRGHGACRARVNTRQAGRVTDLIVPSGPGPLAKLPRSSGQRFNSCCSANPDSTALAAFRSRLC